MQAGGKISSAMSRALKDKKQISHMFFMPAANTLDPAEYTDSAGTVDTDKKLYCDKLRETEITEAAKEGSKFRADWQRMFHRIMGQMCPEMTTRLMRSDKWDNIDNSCDPGRLMTLLQTVCLHGSDKEYFPEKLILSMRELITRKQGNNDPADGNNDSADFSKQTGLNNAVFAQVARLVPGEILVPMPTFWDAFPNLRSFVINKFPADFPFDHNDLAKQTSDIIELLSKRCYDVARVF